MGDERRADRDRDAPARVEAPAPAAPELDEAESGSDTAHASRQLDLQGAQLRGDDEWHSGSDLYPERQVAGVGDQDALWAKFVAAIDAGNGEPLVGLVRDMDRSHRDQAASMLDKIAALVPGRDVLQIGELTLASPGAAVRHAIHGTPPITQRELRAQLAGMPPRQLLILISEPGVLDAIKTKFPGPAVDVAPQILDEEAEGYAELLRWYLDTTPAALVARTMMGRKATTSLTRGMTVLGRAGWLWAFHVDDAMARIAGDEELERYAKETSEADVREFFEAKRVALPLDGIDTKPAVRALRDALDARPVDVPGVLDALRSAEAAGKPVLEARRERFLAAATVADIELATYLIPAFDASEQLDWMLDKPGVSLDELRGVLTTWARGTRGDIDAKTIARVRKTFPDARPEEVFGVVPDGLHQLALDDLKVRRWLIDDAQPLDLLRLVTFAPDRTAELCRWLVKQGVAYEDWVYRLGGGSDDHLLRRFVLQCPDRSVVEYVQQRLLGDAMETQAINDAVGAAPAGTYTAGGLDHVDDAVATKRPKHERADEVSTRVDELSDEDVAALRGDRARLRSVLQRTDASTLARVLARVDPPLREVLLHAPAANAAELAAWAMHRPGDEVREAMAHHTASATAREWLTLGPLELFPALEDGAVLGQVLLRNPGIIDWILTASEPAAALTALGDRGAAYPAAAALAANDRLTLRIPAGRMLTGAARRGLAAIAAAATGDLRDELDAHLELEEGEEESLAQAEHDAGTMAEATAAGSLIEALELALASEDTSDAVVVRVCREKAGEVKVLAKDRPQLFTRIAARTQLGPESLFPSALPIILDTEAGRKWALEASPAFVLLRHAAVDAKYLAALAQDLDADADGIIGWLAGLPRGAALGADEESALQRLCSKITTARAAHRLFRVRFATEIIGDRYDLEEVKRLWGVLERVPDAHIEQASISYFDQFVGGGGAGAYYPDDKHVTLREGLDEPGHNELTYLRTDATATMTEAEAMEALGLDKDGIEAWVQQGRLTVMSSAPTYRLTMTNAGRKYDATVLHEVGHGVDAMLGSQTDLVFGLAGWRVFAESEFDAWATELGGWSSVPAGDQKKIREAWQLWLSSTRGDRAAETLKDMVGPSHPAVSDDHAAVGVVALARKGVPLDVSEPGIVGDRGVLVSFKNQAFYTMSAKALRAAPTPYSLTAPAEWFAECYMVYYRPFDGTPDTADKKGDHLATWIKTWFDAHVDTIGFNPQRDRV